MLAKTNRVTSGDDYKAVVRRGYRVVGPHTVMYLKKNPEGPSARFGFIVAKNVGGAVVRNLVRRRMKAASYELLPSVPAGTDIVIRALPGSERVPWATLHSELSDALNAGNIGLSRKRS